MKILFLLIALLFCASCQTKTKQNHQINHHPNKIDSLFNSKQVEDFVKNIDKKYADFRLIDSIHFEDEKIKYWFDSLKIKTWIKADLDNNGITDLIVYGNKDGNPLFYIIDKGNDQFTMNQIIEKNNISDQFYYLPAVKLKNDKSLVIVYHDLYATKRYKNPRRILTSDTLVYSFGNFIEYNAYPANHNIEKIEFESFGCLFKCPVFGISFINDSSVDYNGRRFNKLNKSMTTKTDGKDFIYLSGLLNYMNFEKLKDSFSVDATDQASYLLTITYDQGKVKKIYNYGYSGTFGLGRLEDKIFDFKTSKNW
jgi:hypothetical protein